MDNRPIGIIDSGIGGLSVAQAIWQDLPRESTIYLADHEFFPYGDKSVISINRRLTKVIEFLLKKKVKLIVIACNTITSTSIKLLRQLYSIPFIGTEPAVKLGLQKNLKENIVVLATKTTSESASLKQLINRFDQRGQIILHPCSGLVEKIEKYAGNITKLQSIIKPYLDSIKEDYSALVLGCTHYALVDRIIKKLILPKVITIEPSSAIAKQTRKILTNFSLLTPKPNSKKLFLTTGDHRSASKSASSLLRQRIMFSSCSF